MRVGYYNKNGDFFEADNVEYDDATKKLTCHINEDHLICVIMNDSGLVAVSPTAPYDQAIENLKLSEFHMMNNPMLSVTRFGSEYHKKGYREVILSGSFCHPLGSGGGTAPEEQVPSNGLGNYTSLFDLLDFAIYAGNLASSNVASRVRIACKNGDYGIKVWRQNPDTSYSLFGEMLAQGVDYTGYATDSLSVGNEVGDLIIAPLDVNGNYISLSGGDFKAFKLTPSQDYTGMSSSTARNFFPVGAASTYLYEVNGNNIICTVSGALASSWYQFELVGIPELVT